MISLSPGNYVLQVLPSAELWLTYIQLYGLNY